MRIVENSQGELKCSGRKIVQTQCPRENTRCDNTNFNTYMLDPTEIIDTVDIGDTIACTISVPGNGYTDLFSEFPLATRQFRTWFSFDYVYEKKVEVTIREEGVAA